MKISIIVAVAKNNVIGYKNKLPWRIPLDLKHFKKTTLGHHVVMGQKTFESIAKPLPGRTIIILSNDPGFKHKNCLVARSIKQALEIAENAGEKELMVAGGASVYKQFLPLADKIYLTKIHHRFEGDAFFPEIDSKIWKVKSKQFVEKGSENRYPLGFLELKKKLYI